MESEPRGVCADLGRSRELEWPSQVMPLEQRLAITVPGLLVPPGGLLSDGVPVCLVFADSNCLFYCAVPRGPPVDAEQARRKLQDARAILELVADRAEPAGDQDVATRLRGQGAGSYPAWTRSRT